MRERATHAFGLYGTAQPTVTWTWARMTCVDESGGSDDRDP